MALTRMPGGSAAVAVVGAVGVWLEALKTAGLTGVAPKGAAVITQLVSTVTSNWECSPKAATSQSPSLPTCGPTSRSTSSTSPPIATTATT